MKDAVEHFNGGCLNLHAAFPLSQRVTILWLAMQCLDAWHTHCGWHPSPGLVMNLLKPRAEAMLELGLLSFIATE